VLYHFGMAEACKTGNNPESDYWIGYSKGIQELFGFKGEPCVEPKGAENTVIQGWVARDEDGELFLYIESPKREYGDWETPSIWASETFAQLDSTLFPDLTWESDPLQVEIILKRKKK